MAGPCFRTDYSAFKEADSAVLAEQVSDYLPISERLVSCLWYTQTYLKNLRTADGRAVRVISPGIWNLEAGPDFMQAAVEFEGGEVVRGDIEIHVRSSHWEEHRHHREPRFDSVIAHVCMWRDTDDMFLSTSSGEKIPQLELSRHLTRPLGKIVGQIETEDFPYTRKAGLGRCAELLATLSKGRVSTLLSIAGEWRILEKAARYAEWLAETSHEEVLYRGLMEALGYPTNKEPFLILAERIPLDVLRLQTSERSGGFSHYPIQSVLMHLSGLFPGEEAPGWDDETAGFFCFMESVWRDFAARTTYFPMDSEKWNLRVRPLNSPLRRIAAASQWVHRHRSQSVFSTMVRIFRDLKETGAEFAEDYDRFRQELDVARSSHQKDDIRKRYLDAVGKLHALFRCEEDKYWSFRYVLGGDKLSRPVSLLGESRVREILVNVAIPILLLHFRQSAEEYESTLYLLYNFLPKLQENKVTRFMRHRLFGRHEREDLVTSAVAQQGLHQLFRDYCSKDRGGCLDCRFQGNLNQWLQRAGGKNP
jgi:hypothetical protein